MTAYIIVFSFLSLINITYFLVPKNRNLIFIVAVLYWIVLTSFMGSRSFSVGTDTELYRNMFYNGSGPFGDPLNAYYYIKQLCYVLDKGYRMFLIIVAALLNFLFILSFLRIEKTKFVQNMYLYISFAYLIQSMNVTRQLIAVGLVFLAVTFIMENKKKAALLLIICAIFFHSTAIVAMFLIPLWNRNINYKIYIFSFAAITAMSMMFYQLFLVILQFFPKYSIYLDPNRESYIGNSGAGLRITILSLFYLLIVFFYLFSRKYSGGSRKYDFISFLVFVGAFSGLLLKQIPNFDRVTMYFTLFSLPLISKTFSVFCQLTKKIKPLNYYIIFISYLSLMTIFYIFYINNWGGTFPYESFNQS